MKYKEKKVLKKKMKWWLNLEKIRESRNCFDKVNNHYIEGNILLLTRHLISSQLSLFLRAKTSRLFLSLLN